MLREIAEREANAEEKHEEAISHYKMAIKLKLDFAITHNNL